MTLSTESEDSQNSQQAAAVDGSPEYIVAVGGSAGGLDAFEHFFAGIPASTGMAFVVIQHLDPTHKALIAELLQRATPMPVHQITDAMPVESNCVYVIPPNANISIHQGLLHLSEPTAPRGMRMPVDSFFQSLAVEQGDKSIAVIVSGMGSDGTLGLKAIKEASGVVMVQDPDTAKFDGMPRSAVSTGLVDFVAPVDELPKKLIAYVSSSLQPEGGGEHELRHAGALQELLRLLKNRTKHDFSLYKKSTLYRRIAKRTNLLQIAGIGAYTAYVKERPEELDIIFQEFLIGVTRFFRDPEAFEYLETHTLPDLVSKVASDSAIRVWVAGCSTGEEAYSISIALHECISELRPNARLSVQIFATDIDSRAIATARKGTYPTNVAADVSQERLDRFFVEVDGGFRINRMIRETVVFAPHNLISDPPFTKMDLITCRNMLIYFSPELQKRVLPTFHYALNRGGVLFLGTAESVSSAGELFVALDTKHRVFRRKEVKIPPMRSMSIANYEPAIGEIRQGDAARQAEPGIPDEVRRTLLERYAPPSVVVDSHGDIVYVSGRTGKYLEPAEGSGNWNVLAMAREGLRRELTRAIHRVSTNKVETKLKNLKVRTNGGYGLIDVAVSPLTSPDSLAGLIMVTFWEAAPGEDDRADAGRDDATREVEPVTDEELRRTQDELRSMGEEMEAAQEELKSANEEVQSANEELTSSKEELESLNEELVTLNTELQAKVNELTSLNNDMANLLNSTEIATLFLDIKLRVKRFTPAAVGMFNLRSVDIGRPITDITQNLSYETIERDVNAVLETLAVQEHQVQSKDGRWYIMRLMPYRTLDNVIDGVVITFSDVTQMKQLEDALRESETLSRALADIGADINESLDTEYVIGLVIAKSSEALGVEGGSLALRDGGEWVVQESLGLPNLSPGTRWKDEDIPYFGIVERELVPVAIDDVALDDRATRAMVDVYGIRSVVGIPLIAGGACVGVLSLISTSGPKTYSAAPILFVRKLATSVSLALTNIRLHKSELRARDEAQNALQTLADQHTQLQQALLPPELPSAPGYRLAARFVPGSAGKLVGGDFYDVFETENGSLAILIGDVAGKGVDAASLAVTTRSTIRAFAYELGDPCMALAHAGEVIYSENGFGERFVTIGLAVLDPKTGRLVYASAGHPPAMVLRADGRVELLWAAQLPMGILRKVECTPFESHLDVGDKLVFYTDGISESRFDGSMYGTEGIQAALETHGHSSAKQTLAALFKEALEFGNGSLFDDAAVVVIERTRQA